MEVKLSFQRSNFISYEAWDRFVLGTRPEHNQTHESIVYCNLIAKATSNLSHLFDPDGMNLAITFHKRDEEVEHPWDDDNIKGTLFWVNVVVSYNEKG